jgi:adenylate kinase family enzyme
MKRVIVIGSGGSGKSTFARELGERTGIQVIHLDREYWRPNWEKTPTDEWEAKVAEMLKGDSWIIDGNFGGTREMRMAAADTIIFLDLPRLVCMYRIFARTAKYYGRSRPDMTEGCYEQLDWDFIKWVWNYPKQSKIRLLRELERFRDKTVVMLKTKSDVVAFLDNLHNGTHK